MPLHTYAKQTVKAICGTERPFIVRDETMLGELTRVIALFVEQEEQRSFAQAVQQGISDSTSADESYRFLIRGNDLDGGFGKQYSIFDLENITPSVTSTLPIKGLTRVRAERLATRIRALIPTGGRYFTADELLLSWVGEPEVWMFLPIFLVNETDYLDDVLELNLASDTRTSQHRVSLYQLTKSPRFQQRLADIRRREQFGQVTGVSSLYDSVTRRLEQQSIEFREVTFHPRRSRPLRMIDILERSGGMTSEDSPYSLSFESWRYLLMFGDKAERQSTEPIDPRNENDTYRVLHPTTQRWHDIAAKMQLLVRVFNRTDSQGNMVPPNTDAVERQFEQLIELLDTNLNEGAALMTTLYPGVSFGMRGSRQSGQVQVDTFLPLLSAAAQQDRNRSSLLRVITSYYYSVKRLRYEVEAAYLALYDDGHSLRILPVNSVLACGGINEDQETLGVQPWGSIQMVTTAGELFVKRFFDPQFSAPDVAPTDTDSAETSNTTAAGQDDSNAPIDPLEALNQSIRTLSSLRDKTDDGQNAAGDSAKGDEQDEQEAAKAEKLREAAEKLLRDEMFAKQSAEELIFEEEPSSQAHGIVNTIRTDFGVLMSTYATPNVQYNDNQFASRSMSLRTSLREAASKVEEARTNITDVDDMNVAELLDKTAYPDSLKMSREYNYTRFAPFYWMFIFGAISVIFGLGSYFWGIIRRTVEMPEMYSIQTTANADTASSQERPDYTNSTEEMLHSAAVFMLFAAVFITFIGGVLRARISGWAPVTNMYETVVFTAFCAGLFGIWYSLYPLLQPVFQLGWQYTCFPSLKLVFKTFFGKKPVVQRGKSETDGEFSIRQAAADFGLPGAAVSPPHVSGDSDTDRQELMNKRKLFWQAGLVLPRFVLMFAVFYFVVVLCNGQDVAENGFFAAAATMFAATDMIDTLTIAASIALIVWYVPHIILAFIPVPFIFLYPRMVASELGILSYKTESSVKPVSVKPASAAQHRGEFDNVFTGEHGIAAVPTDTSGAAWLKLARNNILDRKLFTVIAAAVLVAAGLAAYLNTAQFNPEIRPIAAVLRSNFWLTVHVVAIVLSYAAAFVAWGMSVVALGNIVFGRFQLVSADAGDTLSTDSITVGLPPLSAMFAPVIEKLLKISLLFLVLGTVLGARWADYSWGRFWSWDPKEVWALITIMFYVIVLHGVVARWYGKIGVMVGALFASIAVIITWYGINFVFKGSMHSYGNGASDNAVLFLGVFIVANILWGSLAILRYTAETYGRETPE
ncbi:hypothetical protein FACS1894170_01130 [Planctomycetales bacterium]|nr:hypothetical protein FACS1894170_01130 [Planctomycetales bacterium]